VLISGEYPYNADSVSMLYDTIQAKDVEFPEKKWEYISDDIKDLLERMINRSPGLRISLEECLEHKWFKNVEKIKDSVNSEDSSEGKFHSEIYI